MQKQLQSQKGFTLVELAIVLVIIGLIVSGVLVGQDLIKTAETRSQMSQIEGVDAAMATFRGKYNGLPGDLNNTLASQFGFSTRTGAAGRGDGNGIITNDAGTAVICGEVALAMQDLGAAGLIQGSYPAGIDGAVGTCGVGTSISAVLPAGKLGGFVALYATTAGRNVLQIAGMSGLTAASGAVTASGVLQNIQAYNIDVKMDDGLPTSGRVIGMDTSAGLNDTGYVDDTCVDTSPTPDTYSVGTADANSKECSLQVATSL